MAKAALRISESNIMIGCSGLPVTGSKQSYGPG
jgi:hypothetical protein